MNISSGKISGAQKIVLYGPEGIGKSTFASRLPRPLFIDTEAARAIWMCSGSRSGPVVGQCCKSR